MKSYLFQLLIFLLLFILNTPTLSVYIPRVSPSVVKQITKKIKGLQADHYSWKKTLDKFKKLPLPDAQPAKEIKGLSEIKQYFYDFGYLQQSAPFNDNLDEETISALKTYQRYFNIQVTGDLNNETLQQISLPRCGVPDMNFEYGFTETLNVSWPKGNNWFPFGTRNLTYGFAPESQIPLNVTRVLKNALARWSQTTRVLNFSVISLDASKYWVLPTYNFTWSWKDGEIDLETAVMHQIGHILGLDHSSHNESIMYPTILPSQQRKVQITDSDNKAIQQLYSTKDNNTSSGYVGRFTLFGSSYGFAISLSLGFAFMAMLN